MVSKRESTSWADRALVKPQWLWIVLAMWALVRVIVREPVFVTKLALSPYFVNANLNKSKKMRVGSLWNDLPWFYDGFQAGEV